ncbi:unnamed protein product [Echinostoma caproni]|uniref:Transmembrane protein 45B n=1 Tax=Echinostoma caproni TaxID=27848 RepID=A0A183AGW8_9TREM|nr:unnamed protein product [Echinostoma caproni]
MGTFAGHALPGSFFIFFGLWAAYHALKRFYQQRQATLRGERVEEYVNRISFPFKTADGSCCRGRQIPLDSYLKAICCIVGITGEVYTGFNSDWKFVHIGNAQHSTMFATFGLSGIMELLMFYGVLKVPIQTEFVFGLVALLAEAFLFFFHLHGRTPVDVYVHMLLAGMILVSILAGVGEVLQPRQLVWLLVRNLGILVQGTWFWQVGAVLYPAAWWMPTWNELAKESVPRAANLFCYHILIDFMAMIVIACSLNALYGQSRGRFPAVRIPMPAVGQQHSSDAHMIDPNEEHEMWRSSTMVETNAE